MALQISNIVSLFCEEHDCYFTLFSQRKFIILRNLLDGYDEYHFDYKCVVLTRKCARFINLVKMPAVQCLKHLRTEALKAMLRSCLAFFHT